MPNQGDRLSMSSHEPWTQLADKVRAFMRDFGLQMRACQLEIVFRFDTTDPRAIAEQLGDQALAAIAHWSPPEAAQGAREAAHYADYARQGRQFVDTAELMGGPRDRCVKEKCYQQFRLLVHQIVRRAGFLVAEKEAFQGLSERLRRGRYSLVMATIEDAGEATALLCEHFHCISAAAVREELAFAFVDALETPDRSVDEIKHEAIEACDEGLPAPTIADGGAQIAVPDAVSAQETAAEAAPVANQVSKPQVDEGSIPPMDSAPVVMATTAAETPDIANVADETTVQEGNAQPPPIESADRDVTEQPRRRRPQHASRATIDWRKERVREYKDQQGLDEEGLARRVGLDASVIRAIVREDWRHGKVKTAHQKKLLKTIGVSEEEWYAAR